MRWRRGFVHVHALPAADFANAESDKSKPKGVLNLAASGASVSRTMPPLKVSGWECGSECVCVCVCVCVSGGGG